MNKIKWDERKEIDQLEVVYLHRGAPNDLKRIYGREIVHIGKSFLRLKIEALSEVPEVDGPSAGALMTTLIIAALKNITLPDDVTMTDTKEYIEKNIGIHVEYVDSIKDVMDIIY